MKCGRHGLSRKTKEVFIKTFLYLMRKHQELKLIKLRFYYQTTLVKNKKSYSDSTPKQGAFHGSNSEVEGKLIVKPELAGFDRSNIYELEFMVHGYIRRTKGIVGFTIAIVRK